MNEDYLVRSMNASDVDAVAAIEKAVFSDPWPKSAFREFLEVENRINLVLQLAGGGIAGYVLAQLGADELQIQNIAVAPEYRRRQLGSLLLVRAESEGIVRGALCSVLEVRTTNEAALGLYHSFGYRMIGRRKDYYRRPVCDALVLFRRLEPAEPGGMKRESSDGVVS